MIFQEGNIVNQLFIASKKQKPTVKKK